MVITEQAGNKSALADNRIAMIAPGDEATGRRNVKGLQKIVIGEWIKSTGPIIFYFMAVNILLFGRLIDIVGTETVTLDGIIDTYGLVASLTASYPGLTHTSYLIAVDKKVVSANTLLTNNCTVALLPPYSGG